MNYQVFASESLVMMHHGARGALAVGDELNKLGQEPRFRVRETPDWKKHVEDLEAEMTERRMMFDVIDWFENQRFVRASKAALPPAFPQQEPCSLPTDTATLLSNRIAAIMMK